MQDRFDWKSKMPNIGARPPKIDVVSSSPTIHPILIVVPAFRYLFYLTNLLRESLVWAIVNMIIEGRDLLSQFEISTIFSVKDSYGASLVLSNANRIGSGREKMI